MKEEIIIERKKILSFLDKNTKFNVNEIKIIKKLDGLSNENYRISFNSGDKVFLRISSKNYENFDRKNELEVIKIASKAKLTPKPCYFDFKCGNMILPWIKGTPPKESDFSNDCFMKKLCINLKKFHNYKVEKEFNPFEHIRKQIKLCKDKNLRLPSYFNILVDRLNKLEQELGRNINMGLCHNDFNYSNIMISDDNIYFIDFEYSAMNDIFYDLATISWLLTIDERKELLKNYFGYYREEDYKKLVDYLYVVKISNGLWSILKSEEGNTEYDYLKGADIVFEELISNHSLEH